MRIGLLGKAPILLPPALKAIKGDALGGDNTSQEIEKPEEEADLFVSSSHDFHPPTPPSPILLSSIQPAQAKEFFY